MLEPSPQTGPPKSPTTVPMYSLLSFLLSALLVTTTFAQQNGSEQRPSNDDFSYLNLTFHRRNTADCSRLTTNQQDNAFEVFIHSIPRSRVCFNFDGDSSFIPQINDTDSDHSERILNNEEDGNSQKFQGYQAPEEEEEPCPPDGRDDCGVRYSLLLSSSRQNNNTFTYTTDYTQVLYSQQRADTSDDDDKEFGNLNFRTYTGSGCMPHASLPLEHSWNCGVEESEAECANVGADYVIDSFSIEPVTEEQRDSGSCVIAAQRSTGSVVGRSAVVAFMSFVFSYATIAMIV